MGAPQTRHRDTMEAPREHHGQGRWTGHVNTMDPSGKHHGDTTEAPWGHRRGIPGHYLGTSFHGESMMSPYGASVVSPW